MRYALRTLYSNPPAKIRFANRYAMLCYYVSQYNVAMSEGNTYLADIIMGQINAVSQLEIFNDL